MNQGMNWKPFACHWRHNVGTGFVGAFHKLSQPTVRENHIIVYEDNVLGRGSGQAQIASFVRCNKTITMNDAKIFCGSFGLQPV